MRSIFRNIGPGTLIAAAFIGPGTVTVCTLAGVTFGFTLLWAMLLSITATIVLQEMAARLGLISGKGLAEALKEQLQQPVIRSLVILLVLSAVLIGNAAYEAGNISGGALGLEAVFPNFSFQVGSTVFNPVVPIIGVIAFLLLYFGNYRVLERSLIVLVLMMSVSFLVTAVISAPDITEVLKGMFLPKVPEQGWLTVVALVGTTVVPYNLFLHAALVREKWNGKNSLKLARVDTYTAVILGGIISMAIIVSAAAVEIGSVTNAADLALAVKPLFGNYASILIGIGLFAAGITSAITAPLAAAYVARECFGWEKDMKNRSFRAIWFVVLLTGVIFSSLGFKPIEVIKFAQVANGLLLPLIAIFLLWIVNRKAVMGEHRNGILTNFISFIIIAITVLLGVRSFIIVFFE